MFLSSNRSTLRSRLPEAWSTCGSVIAAWRIQPTSHGSGLSRVNRSRRAKASFFDDRSENAMKMQSVTAACVLGLAGLAISPAAAQEYPSKPIRFVVPYNPGGSYDTIARLVGQKLTEKWNQQVVIENRPGAGSLIGTELAAKAAPDGYTMVMYGNNQAILPSVHTKATINVQKDFDPVSMVAITPALIVVHPALPAKTVAELIKLAKDKPGQLNFGSGGNGSATHLGMEMFKQATGTDIVHVPYKAGVPATMDL